MISTLFWWRGNLASVLPGLKGIQIFYYFCKRGNSRKEILLVNKAASGHERRWDSFQQRKQLTMEQNYLCLNSCHDRQHITWHTPNAEMTSPFIPKEGQVPECNPDIRNPTCWLKTVFYTAVYKKWKKNNNNNWTIIQSSLKQLIL